MHEVVVRALHRSFGGLCCRCKARFGEAFIPLVGHPQPSALGTKPAWGRHARARENFLREEDVQWHDVVGGARSGEFRGR